LLSGVTVHPATGAGEIEFEFGSGRSDVLGSMPTWQVSGFKALTFSINERTYEKEADS